MQWSPWSACADPTRLLLEWRSAAPDLPRLCARALTRLRRISVLALDPRLLLLPSAHPGTVPRDEARRLLTSGVRACTHCKLDAQLRILD
ncbi:DUF6233 domain-containing protein [Streptomyces mirabilis]|uniref:DUF6233 domain-containing protein n=1 Tax=Streptomyces mirabilis TaxID=68239 RepID=UPI00332A3D4D